MDRIRVCMYHYRGILKTNFEWVPHTLKAARSLKLTRDGPSNHLHPHAFSPILLIVQIRALCQSYRLPYFSDRITITWQASSLEETSWWNIVCVYGIRCLIRYITTHDRSDLCGLTWFIVILLGLYYVSRRLRTRRGVVHYKRVPVSVEMGKV